MAIVDPVNPLNPQNSPTASDPGDRPFAAFRTAITDSAHFIGRQTLLNTVQRSPFRVRIFLGGRRSGKTSVLNALRWTLLNAPQTIPNRALPVLFDFQQEQPQTLDNLRYLFILRLQEALDHYHQGKESGLRRTYNRFMRQISSAGVSFGALSVEVNNPLISRGLIHEDFRQDLLNLIQQVQKQKFEGICFLLDNAEYVVQQSWGNDAWSYIRALKDTDTAINPFVGFCLSGYRNLKDYQQRVGSPLLNIAEIDWITPWTAPEVQTLLNQRMQAERITLNTTDQTAILNWGGGQPYLTQQLLNSLLDARHQGKAQAPDLLLHHQVRHYDRDFSAWWDAKHSDYGFSEPEQRAYLALAQMGTGSIEALTQACQFSWGMVADIMEVLVGTGVIQARDDETYQLGSQLFATWVTQEHCLGETSG